MTYRFLAVWMVAALLLVTQSSTAFAQPGGAHVVPPPESAEGRARESFQRGRIHYDNGEFDAAALAFEEAYALSGRDALLYNLYLAYRDANQQEKAASALRKYLERVEVVENRAQLEARLKALDEGLAQKRAAEPVRPAEPVVTTPVATEPSAPPVDTEPKKWWLVPSVVTGVGGVMMLAAIPTAFMVKSKQNELDDKCTANVCDASLKSTADSGKTLSYVTDALLFGGAAVAATGVVLLLVKKPKREEVPVASLGCTHSGCAGSVTMRF